MTLSPEPSTTWTEEVGPDEEARHRELSERISRLQLRLNDRFGPGRAFHRQQIAGVHGELTITASEPELRQGLFSRTGSKPVVVRMSHGAIAPHADVVPDIQGFALSVRRISGPGALGGRTNRQDFLLINRPAFGLTSSREFGDLIEPVARGQAALARHLIAAHGPVSGSVELARLTADIARPFSGFATARFHSAAPIAFGDYAAQVRLVPKGAGRRLTAPLDFHKDLAQRLRTDDLTYELQVQFYLDVTTTPIEDLLHSRPSDASPFHPVARLTLPQQDIDSEQGQDLAKDVETDRFDPWQALAAHRPLGEVMRARRAAYYSSAKNRGAG